VLDEWLDVEDVVVGTADDAVLDPVGRSSPTTELNTALPPVVEGLADGEAAATEVVWTDAEFVGDV